MAEALRTGADFEASVRFKERKPANGEIAAGDMLAPGHETPQFHARLANGVDLSAVHLVFCAGPWKAQFTGEPPRRKALAAPKLRTSRRVDIVERPHCSRM